MIESDSQPDRYTSNLLNQMPVSVLCSFMLSVPRTNAETTRELIQPGVEKSQPLIAAASSFLLRFHHLGTVRLVGSREKASDNLRSVIAGR